MRGYGRLPREAAEHYDDVCFFTGYAWCEHLVGRSTDDCVSVLWSRLMEHSQAVGDRKAALRPDYLAWHVVSQVRIYYNEDSNARMWISRLGIERSEPEWVPEIPPHFLETTVQIGQTAHRTAQRVSFWVSVGVGFAAWASFIWILFGSGRDYSALANALSVLGGGVLTVLTIVARARRRLHEKLYDWLWACRVGSAFLEKQKSLLDKLTSS